jgi:hypothetical protein
MPLTPDEARGLALALPEAVEQDHHGKAPSRVGVTLVRADRGLVAGLLADAWEGRAPARLLRSR